VDVGFQSLVGDNAQVTYTTAKVALGPFTTPDDAYASTYYSALAYLNAGVTTISNQTQCEVADPSSRASMVMPASAAT
jgi:hypothetical protein